MCNNNHKKEDNNIKNFLYISIKKGYLIPKKICFEIKIVITKLFHSSFIETSLISQLLILSEINYRQLL